MCKNKQVNLEKGTICAEMSILMLMLVLSFLFFHLRSLIELYNSPPRWQRYADPLIIPNNMGQFLFFLTSEFWHTFGSWARDAGSKNLGFSEKYWLKVEGLSD